MAHFPGLLTIARYAAISAVLVLVGLTLSLAAPVYASSAPQAQLWGCTNGPATAPGDCTGVQQGTTTHGWSSNGNIQLNISHYVESNVVPWRVEMTNMPANTTVTLVILYSFVNGAITWDYTQHWDSTVSSSSAGPCDGTALAGCGMTPTSRLNIPIPPVLNQAAGGSATNYTCPIAPPGNQNMTIPNTSGHMEAYQVTLTQIAYNLPVPSCILPNPNSDDSFTVTFETPAVCTWNGNAMLLWGQHVGDQLDWGPGNTASSLGSGGTASPYHVALQSWSFKQGTSVNPTPCPNQNLATNGLNTQQIQMKIAGTPTAVTLSNFIGRQAAGNVNLEWTTSTELNTAGFNIYRSQNPKGPYVRVNSNLIPASKAALIGSRYSFQDHSAAPGQTYYYQVEEVLLNGTSTRHDVISIPVAAWSPTDNILLPFGLGIGALALAGAVWGLRRRRAA